VGSHTLVDKVGRKGAAVGRKEEEEPVDHNLRVAVVHSLEEEEPVEHTLGGSPPSRCSLGPVGFDSASRFLAVTEDNPETNRTGDQSASRTEDLQTRVSS